MQEGLRRHKSELYVLLEQSRDHGLEATPIFRTLEIPAPAVDQCDVPVERQLLPFQGEADPQVGRRLQVDLEVADLSSTRARWCANLQAVASTRATHDSSTHAHDPNKWGTGRPRRDPPELREVSPHSAKRLPLARLDARMVHCGTSQKTTNSWILSQAKTLAEDAFSFSLSLCKCNRSGGATATHHCCHERWGDRTSTNEYTVTDTPVELMELMENLYKYDKYLWKTYENLA